MTKQERAVLLEVFADVYREAKDKLSADDCELLDRHLLVKHRVENDEWIIDTACFGHELVVPIADPNFDSHIEHWLQRRLADLRALSPRKREVLAEMRPHMGRLGNRAGVAIDR